jgi:N-acyl-D-amino-acid deacylase
VKSALAVQPTSRFRIASISKPITAAAILTLVQARKLRLDDKVQDILNLEEVTASNSKRDPRIHEVTIRDLLNHSGGWAREQDPTADAGRRFVRNAFGISSEEYRPDHLVLLMFSRHLDFDPGTKFKYSNLGYSVLGRVIEKVSGQPYETYVQRNVLAKVGITKMHLGQRSIRAGEVNYYTRARRSGVALKGQFLNVSRSAAVHTYDAFGGWVGSPIDLLRFACALDNPKRCRFLSESGVEAMFSRPQGPLGLKDDGSPRTAYYSFGWEVRLNSEGRTTWHSGSLEPGTSSMLYRRRDRISWALVCSMRSGPDGEKLRDTIHAKLHKAADQVMKSRLSPRLDLFKSMIRL